MTTRLLVLGLLLLPTLGRPPAASAQADRKTWAERLELAARTSGSSSSTPTTSAYYFGQRFRPAEH
ncbi:MAG: hypothetical protein U0797_14550 [Gemmataceae bacterium]